MDIILHMLKKEKKGSFFYLGRVEILEKWIEIENFGKQQKVFNMILMVASSQRKRITSEADNQNR